MRVKFKILDITDIQFQILGKFVKVRERTWRHFKIKNKNYSKSQSLAVIDKNRTLGIPFRQNGVRGIIIRPSSHFSRFVIQSAKLENSNDRLFTDEQQPRALQWQNYLSTTIVE